MSTTLLHWVQWPAITGRKSPLLLTWQGRLTRRFISAYYTVADKHNDLEGTQTVRFDSFLVTGLARDIHSTGKSVDCAYAPRTDTPYPATIG